MDYSFAGVSGKVMEDGGTFSVSEWTLQPGGFAPPPHRHRTIDEVVYVLEGELEFTDGERVWNGPAGTSAGFPAGTTHGMTVRGETPARLLIIASAPELTRAMFEGLTEAFADGPPSEEAFLALIERIDMEPVA
jgi:uncharacterized cupin superfamily protein